MNSTWNRQENNLFVNVGNRLRMLCAQAVLLLEGLEQDEKQPLVYAAKCRHIWFILNISCMYKRPLHVYNDTRYGCDSMQRTVSHGAD